MSEHTKKHPTKGQLKLKDAQGKVYVLPKKIAQKYIIKNEDQKNFSVEEFFQPYERKYTKPGLLLRGLRIREGLTQEEFAQMINITQANLSLMENGRRVIGKNIAKRIQEVFNVDYRIFLE